MKLPRPSDLPDDESLEQSEHSTPEYWMGDAEVEDLAFEYPDRAPEDWVISGPLGNARGPGRSFRSWGAAERWAREFYGDRLKGRIQEAQEGTRWAFLIRGPRGG